MKVRRILFLAVLGLLGGSLFVDEAQACSKCRRGRGRTYHYNGAQGYWGGGPYQAPIAYAPPSSAYAMNPAYNTTYATYAPSQAAYPMYSSAYGAPAGYSSAYGVPAGRMRMPMP